MKKLLVALCFIVGSLAIAGGPSLYGYSGLVTAPTADAVKLAGASGIISTTKDMNTIAGSVGVFTNWELSGASLSNKERKTLINGKILLLPESIALPAIAVGVIDITDEVGSSLYAVASKTLSIATVPAKAAGLSIGAPRVSAGMADGKVIDGLFLGLALPLSRDSEIMAELVNKKVNFALKVKILPLTEAEVFTLEGNLGAALSVKVGF